MRKEYTTLEEILEDAETGKISQSHLMDELVSKILLNKFNDINNKKKWVCATCKDEYMESM